MELSLNDLKPFLPGLESVLDDDEVSELMVNGPGTVFVERGGRMTAMRVPELDEAAVLRAAVQIARPLGRDPHTEPIIDARLGDGSRVAICSPPASPCAAITIRRFGGRAFTMAELVASGAVSPVVVDEARHVLQYGGNILIAGGTGSGKTTLLNALVALLPEAGRIVSIEDTLELQLRRANCVRFEARGLTGAVTIRDLVRHALRHRPDHIVVGEVRGAEAADLLQALNTGHGGLAGDGPRESCDGGALAVGELRDASERCAALVGRLSRGGRWDRGGDSTGAVAGGCAPGHADGARAGL